MRDLSGGKIAAFTAYGFLLNAVVCYTSHSVTKRNAENSGPLSIFYGFLVGMTVSGVVVGASTLSFRYCKLLEICKNFRNLEPEVKKKVYLSIFKLSFVTTLITSTITAGLSYKPPFQDYYYVGGVLGFITIIAYLGLKAAKNDPVNEILKRRQTRAQDAEMVLPLTQSSSQVALTS